MKNKAHSLLLIKDGNIVKSYSNIGDKFNKDQISELFIIPYLTDCMYYGQETVKFDGNYYKMLYTCWYF